MKSNGSMGRRRYLNLLVHNNHDDLYSLRRIPANRLFYPSARAAEAAAMAKSYIDHDGKRPHPGALHFMDRFRNFPCPLLNLQPTPMHHRNERSLDLVTLLGDDETKILTADNHGHTVLFDAASYSVVHFPNLNCSKGYDAMAVSINQEPDCLYVLNLRHHPTTSNHCFEVLSYGDPHMAFSTAAALHNDHPNYNYLLHNTFYVSSKLCGTHAFDTVSRQWRPISSLWSMPFLGKAQYVPELKLWFGLSCHHPHSLCACDLTNIAQGQLHTWLDLDIPESWSPIRLDLISLGSGRFCVAKMFSSMMQDDEIHMEFAVLTGLQMVPPRGTKDDQQAPWMVKHKSICYPFGYYNIKRVF
uniref:DUF1618 domain-containing protein n=1 Tax=Oryza barthii TaxID=65489 RepID=A0A0D3HHE3_9ORYZ